MRSCSLPVSPVTLGTVQLGLDYGIANRTGKPDGEECFRILDVAYERGITTFDTAIAYGDSQKVIGRWLESRKVKANVITKIPRIERGLDPQSCRRKIAGLLERSFSELNTDFLTGIMCHSSDTYGEYAQCLRDIVAAYMDKKKIGWFGLSVYSPVEITNLQGDSFLKGIQVPGNMLDHRFLTMPENQLTENIFVRSVFLQGLLLMNPGQAEVKVAGAGRWLKALHAVARKHSLPMDQLAYRFVRSFSQVRSIVIGVETEKQIKSNIALVNMPGLPEAMVEEIRSVCFGVGEKIYNPSLWRQKN